MERKLKLNFTRIPNEIVYDDFGKIDLRTGVITSAQKVPKADKLLQLEVDLGFEKRTILSGIAMHFEPEAVDKKDLTRAIILPLTFLIAAALNLIYSMNF
jgi:methionyl-tRNA synthetase